MVAESCVSFVKRLGAAWTMEDETAVDGGIQPSIVYNATRCSGPFDLPVLGRASTSVAACCADAVSSGRILDANTANSLTDVSRTVALLDFEAFRVGISTRRNPSTV